jgi:predicted site-specific integrase-resolvase
VIVSLAEVTAAEAARLLGIDRHLIYVWRGKGKVAPVGKRGKSPLYRWADLVAVERDTSSSGRSYRGPRVTAA